MNKIVLVFVFVPSVAFAMGDAPDRRRNVACNQKDQTNQALLAAYQNKITAMQESIEEGRTLLSLLHKSREAINAQAVLVDRRIALLEELLKIQESPKDSA